MMRKKIYKLSTVYIIIPYRFQSILFLLEKCNWLLFFAWQKTTNALLPLWKITFIIPKYKDSRRKSTNKKIKTKKDKGVAKLPFTLFSCGVIILFNTSLNKSRLSTYSFRKLVFCLSVLFMFSISVCSVVEFVVFMTIVKIGAICNFVFTL